MLDELIEAYNGIPEECIFRFGTKRSTEKTARELMVLMPQFTKRLQQRQYDMALMSSTLRRYVIDHSYQHS